MATISATAAASSIALLHRPAFGAKSSSVNGLPAIARKGRAMCSMGDKAPASVSQTGMSSAFLAAVSAVTMSSPALALVDERLSTEGTGLPFGVSNNLLVWILLGVFALIWALYSVYTTSLDEDEESGGLSL